MRSTEQIFVASALIVRPTYSIHLNHFGFVTVLTIRPKIFCLPVSYQKKLRIKVYKTIILSVVLYGCEKWFLTLRKEHRLRVFENRVL